MRDTNEVGPNITTDDLYDDIVNLLVAAQEYAKKDTLRYATETQRLKHLKDAAQKYANQTRWYN